MDAIYIETNQNFPEPKLLHDFLIQDRILFIRRVEMVYKEEWQKAWDRMLKMVRDYKENWDRISPRGNEERERNRNMIKSFVTPFLFMPPIVSPNPYNKTEKDIINKVFSRWDSKGFVVDFQKQIDRYLV